MSKFIQMQYTHMRFCHNWPHNSLNSFPCLNVGLNLDLPRSDQHRTNSTTGSFMVGTLQCVEKDGTDCITPPSSSDPFLSFHFSHMIVEKLNSSDESNPLLWPDYGKSYFKASAETLGISYLGPPRGF